LSAAENVKVVVSGKVSQAPYRTQSLDGSLYRNLLKPLTFRTTDVSDYWSSSRL